MPKELLELLIRWSPTILFVLIILSAFLLGIIRGFRKSAILFIHMLVIGSICIGVYIWLVQSPQLDEKIVSLVNGVLRSFGQSLQGIFNVSSDCTTLHEMLMELVLGKLSPNQIVYYVVLDNGAYIQTLVNFLYHIVLFVFMILIYLLLIFIMYLIYLLFYPVRRKVKRQEIRFQQGLVSHPYRKRRLLGGAVGAFRGVIIAVIGFSFLGTLIWMVSGGTHTAQRGEYVVDDDDISFGNENYDEIYDYYSYICEMGDTGIFKVLNSMRDTENTPYYFYIADMVLQGKLNDPVLGVTDATFYLRDETGTYMAFCKDVLNLLMKYGQNDFSRLMSGLWNNELDTMDILFEIMNKEGFSTEFDQLIDRFEAKTYFVNIALSSLTSLVNHVDMINMNEELKGVIKAFFTEETSIKVTDLASEADVKNLFKTVIDVISTTEVSQEESTQQKMIAYAQMFIPTVKNLSCFKDEKREKMNRCLGGVYTYCANHLVEGEVSLPEIPDQLDWMGEFDNLLDVTVPMLGISRKIVADSQDEIISNLLAIFEGEDAEEMEGYYDEIIEKMTNSYLLDVVFKSSTMGNAMNSMVQQMTNNPNSKIPLKAIDYNNKVVSGKIQYGECYYLLTAFKALIINGGAEFYEKITSGELTASGIVDILSILNVQIDEDLRLIDELLRSKVMYYMLSALLTDSDFGGIRIVVPQSALDGLVVDEEVYHIVDETELDIFINTFINNTDVLVEFMDSEEFQPSKIFNNQKFLDAISESIILEGTISQYLIDTLSSSDRIVLPMGYNQIEPWLSTKKDGEVSEGELGAMIDAVQALSSNEDFDLDGMMSGSFSLNSFKDLTEEEKQDLLKSKVLHYTISKELTQLGSSGFEVVVPTDTLEEGNHQDIYGQRITVIAKENIQSVINSIFKVASFDSENNAHIQYKEIFANKEEILQDEILHATLINLVYKMSLEDSAVLSLPERYRVAAEQVKTEPFRTNLWLGEDPDLTTDDEMYFLLESIEGIHGTIEDDFDLESDFNQMTLTKENAHFVSESVILNATLTKNLLKAQLNIPTDVYMETDETIQKEEMNQLLVGLIGLVGEEENGEPVLKLDHLESIQMDQSEIQKTDLETALNSRILTYVISDQIRQVSEIILPDSVLETLDVETETGILQNQQQIQKNDLSQVFQALFTIMQTDSLLMSEISYDHFRNIPEEDDASVIFESVIFRATISKTVMTDRTIENNPSYFDLMNTDGQDIVVLKKEELSTLVRVMRMFGTTDYEHLQLDLMSLMNHASKDQLLEQIAASSIYRVLLSQQLKTNDIYKLLTTDSSGSGSYTYQSLGGGRYCIQDPKSVSVRTGFASSVETNEELFDKEDIVALKNCNLING